MATCAHSLIHMQACVSVGTEPAGPAGAGGVVCPSVPGLTIQMAPFTNLLPVPLPESGSYFQALLLKLVGGGLGGPGRATPASVQLSAGGAIRAGRGEGTPSSSSVPAAAGLGPGWEAASQLQAFTRAGPAWDALPPWHHWLALAPAVAHPLLG